MARRTIARVHPVHSMNAEQRQVAADPKFGPSQQLEPQVRQ